MPFGTQILPRVAHHAVRRLQLGREQRGTSGALAPSRRRRRAARPPAGGRVRRRRRRGLPRRSATPSGLLRAAAARSSATASTAPSVIASLLRRAHVVEPAALARVQPQAGVLLEGRARSRELRTAMSCCRRARTTARYDLRGGDRDLAPRLFRGDGGDAHLVRGLVLPRPSGRRARKRNVAVALKVVLCPRLGDVAVEPAGVVQDGAARGAEQRWGGTPTSRRRAGPARGGCA